MLLFRTFNKENLAKTASNITQDLMSIARMMDGRVKQSEADMQILGKIHKEGRSKFIIINPLTPRSDEHLTSPCNNPTLFSKQVMRILRHIMWNLLV